MIGNKLNTKRIGIFDQIKINVYIYMSFDILGTSDQQIRNILSLKEENILIDNIWNQVDNQIMEQLYAQIEDQIMEYYNIIK